MYLHEVNDAGTRLLFEFRSGTHGLNDQLVGIGGGMARQSVLCVVPSVRVWSMCCGNVLLTKIH